MFVQLQKLKFGRRQSKRKTHIGNHIPNNRRCYIPVQNSTYVEFINRQMRQTM